MTRLPMVPNGVSARAANAATARVGVHGVQHGRDEPGQAADGERGQRHGYRPGLEGAHGHRDDHQRGDGHGGEAADHGGQQREGQPGHGAARAALLQPEHGPQHPGQAGIAEQQRPLADDEPFGDVGVPAVEHGGGQTGEHGLAVQERGRARAGQHEDQQQDEFLHDVGREQAGGDGDGEVARHRPRRPAGQPEHRRGERLAGYEHHVVAEQEPAPEPGPEREQPEDEPGDDPRAEGRRGTAGRGDHDGPRSNRVWARRRWPGRPT